MGTSDKIKVSTIVPGVIIDETIFEIKATIALPFRSRLTRLVVHVQSFLLFCFAFFFIFLFPWSSSLELVSNGTWQTIFHMRRFRRKIDDLMENVRPKRRSHVPIERFKSRKIMHVIM